MSKESNKSNKGVIFFWQQHILSPVVAICAYSQPYPASSLEEEEKK